MFNMFRSLCTINFKALDRERAYVSIQLLRKPRRRIYETKSKLLVVLTENNWIIHLTSILFHHIIRYLEVVVPHQSHQAHAKKC